MKTLKQIIEVTKTVKDFKVGKKKNITASIVKNKNNKFDAIIDGDKLDSYNSAQDAEKAIADIIKLLGK